MSIGLGRIWKDDGMCKTVGEREHIVGGSHWLRFSVAVTAEWTPWGKGGDETWGRREINPVDSTAGILGLGGSTGDVFWFLMQRLRVLGWGYASKDKVSEVRLDDGKGVTLKTRQVSSNKMGSDQSQMRGSEGRRSQMGRREVGADLEEIWASTAFEELLGSEWESF